MKKNTAIFLVSGVLVLALVVVAALAIAGVFNVKNNTIDPIALADDDPAIAEQQLFRGFAEDTVLYVKSVDGSKVTGSVGSILRVRNNNGNVNMVSSVAPDAAGNPGFKPQDGWTAGMYYSVDLASGYEFVNEAYAGLNSFECIIASRPSTDDDVKLSANVVYLQKGAFKTSALGSTGYYTLEVTGDYDESIANPVFVLDDGMASKSYRLVQDAQVVKTATGFVTTVEDAEVDDVYDELYVNKSFTLGDGVGFEIDTEATEASIRNSGWFLAVSDYLYGESLEDSNAKKKWVDFKIDPSFEAGSPSKIKLNISVIFKGIVKNAKDERDPDSQIKIIINNVLTPVFDVHIQKEEDSKGFDANLALDIDTTAMVTFTYSKSGSSYGDNANDTMEAIASKVASLVKKVVSDKYDNSANPCTFAKWVIPIGALPICIEDTMGIELAASFSGEVKVAASNSFHVEAGVVYADGDLKGYGNVDDQFHFEGVSLAGTAGARVGLSNAIGISAYGVISVDLGLHGGVYADIAGRIDLEGDDIIGLFSGKPLNIVPAYYFEAGVYVDLTASGKLFGFTIKQFTLLSKKFPLFTAGHKYLPVTSGEDNPFVDETIYMESSYYYIQNWDVYALDIQDLRSVATARTLAYSEFDYELGEGLRMEGNKLIATKAGAYETSFKVTSKVNKQLSKVVTVIKNPEIPTVTVSEKVFDMNGSRDVLYRVMLNGSKLINVLVDGKSVEYTFEDNNLTLKGESLAALKLSLGSHSVAVESSKGYLDLSLRVVNSKAIEVDTSNAVFDKKDSSSALVWDMKLQGNAVVSVEEDGQAISSKYYSYRDADGKFVMSASYWNAKESGDYVEKVTLTNGDTFQLNVRVQDSRDVKLLTSVYSYVYGSNEDLDLAVELYDSAITSITFDGLVIKTDKAVIDAEYFDGKEIGEYTENYVNGMQFTVVITKANNAIVIPVQTATFYKSNPQDVEFAITKMANDFQISEGAIVKGESIVIPAEFLMDKSGEWTTTVVADNTVILTVEIVNDLMPTIAESEITISGDEVKAIEWQLQGYTLADVYVDGLDAAAYTKALSGLQVKGAALGYGETQATIYTPVNALTFTVSHVGTPSIFPTASLNKQSKAETVVSYALDLAHLTFDYVTVDGVSILPIQYRYGDGVLTFSNDFVYNLAEGSYNVNVVLTDGKDSTTLTAQLIIQGSAPAVDTVGSGDASNPFLIYTADQLANVASYVNEGNNLACYKLMADIDMMGQSVEPIGTKDYPFKGIFDGNGYTISNLSITKTVKVEDGGYAIGMFGFVDESGVVEGVRLSQASVNFAQSGSVSAGLIAGRNAGTISGIYINGSKVNAESKSWMDIKNAYFDVGGVVGYNNGGVVKNVDVTVELSAKVKGLNIAGLQITGRKSLINIGAAVGYFTTESKDSESLISNIKVTANISTSIDNKNPVNQNGWYGFTDLSETAISKSIKRCKVAIAD